MKTVLSFEELENQTAVELPDRELMQVAIGAGGLVGVGIAVDANVVVTDVIDIENNEICVAVAAVGSAAGCQQ